MVMRTLQIGVDWFPEWGIGGLERYFYDFTRYLPAADIETYGLVTGSQEILNPINPSIYGFGARDSSLFQRLYRLRQLGLKILKSHDCSLISSHFVLYTLPLLDVLGQQPFVFHFHGPWADESVLERNLSLSLSIRKRLEQIVFHRANAFVVLSRAYQELLHRNHHIPLERIHVVPGAVEMSRFNLSLSKSQAREQLGWPQDRRIIFTARRLSKRMGLENLISAMKEVSHRYPDVLLLIAGKGDLKEALNAQIEALGLTHHVNLLGYVSDPQLNLTYRAAHLAVIPTLALEGFGLIVLEALASGTPIMGTPIGGIPEILRPFSEDLVFESASVSDIRLGLLEALSGERMLPSEQACIDYIYKNYTWPVITQRIKSIYEKVIDDY
jgi:glycosyltransferase involved in cell wall biosynthesis